jgi:hypothetical protein
MLMENLPSHAIPLLTVKVGGQPAHVVVPAREVDGQFRARYWRRREPGAALSAVAAGLSKMQQLRILSSYPAHESVPGH